MASDGFWQALDTLAAESEIIIDRPKGSAHPRYPKFIYPLDYGYLKGTAAMDGGGIDVWRGSGPAGQIDAVMCIVDLVKRDSEIKVLIGCTEEEKALVYQAHNETDMQKGVLIRRTDTQS
ncbi:MAG: inorganic pyrophosphatase [Oscillospiraceae bacterium]|jgi:inorganic pyrophosphatase|nr:inorganic pyrophosphatase [Oscillospiraceae bacterium]